MTNVSDTKLQAIIKWEPHKNQKLILACNEREVIIAAGRRFGKSAICAYLALKILIQDNKKVWIVAPSYDLTNKVFDYVVKWYLRFAPEQAVGISYRPTPKIKTPGGSILECKSTENPTGLLGEEVDLEIIDEASRISRHIYDTYLYPVTSSRKGRIFSISTPYGKDHFYEKWLMAKQNNAAFQFTSLDGVSVDEEEWSLMQKRLPEQVFKQEYMALFLEDAASVFRNVLSLVDPTCLELPRKDRRYVMGVDLGKVNDFTVLTMVDTYSHKVVAWERFKELDYFFQEQRINNLANQYNKARVIMDVSQAGGPIVESLRRRGVNIDDYKFTNKSKNELVEKLSLFIDNKGILVPDNAILLDELSAFSYQISDSRNIRYGAPEGLHDDAVISLALAVWGIQTPKKEDPLHIVREKPKTKVYEYQ